MKPLKFLNFWTKHQQFKGLIEENWKVEFLGYLFLIFQAKIKKIKEVLKKWSKEAFGDIFCQIDTLEDVIKTQEAQLVISPSERNMLSLKKAEAELRKYWHFEEEYWKQKAGMRWVKDEDKNTKFFHNYVKGRRKRLRIHDIQTT